MTCYVYVLSSLGWVLVEHVAMTLAVFSCFFWVGIGSIFIVWILFNLNESLLSFLCDTIFNLRVMLKLHYLIIRAYEIASSWVARYNITLDVYSLLFGYFMVANYLFLIG
jgi:hypothetical protein